MAIKTVKGALKRLEEEREQQKYLQAERIQTVASAMQKLNSGYEPAQLPMPKYEDIAVTGTYVSPIKPVQATATPIKPAPVPTATPIKPAPLPTVNRIKQLNRPGYRNWKKGRVKPLMPVGLQYPMVNHLRRTPILTL